MAETPVKTSKAQPSAFRQDLLRGLRWGTILLLVMLLGITAYRVLSSSEATASQPAEAQKVAAPIASPAAPIQVGPVLKGPDAVPTPVAPKARRARVTEEVVVPEPPQRLHAPAFAPAPGIPPRPPANGFVAAPLPSAEAVAGIETPAPGTTAPALAVAPPQEDAKQANRATRAVRSVGRIFGFGRKRDDSKAEPEKK